MLSAYIDGELSAQERAAIDRWLEQSPDARRKLDDFRRLSSIFAGLPRTEVPQEFPVKVLQLAERRMLLPEAGVVSPRRTIHRWFIAVGVSAVAAAGLLLILQLAFRPADMPPVELANRSNENSAAPRVAAEDAQSELGNALGKEGQTVAQTERLRNPEIESARGDAVAVPAPPLVATRKSSDVLRSEVAVPGAAAAKTGSVVEGEANGIDAKVANKASARAVNAQAKDADAANPQLADINLAIDAVRDVGAEKELVSVVKVIVVDRADGMKLVQNYFSENGVLLSENASADVREKQAGGGAGQDGANRRDESSLKAAKAGEALYIEAEPSQVVAAFKKILDAENAGLRVVVEDPIAIAALDSASQEQLKRMKVGSPATLKKSAASFGAKGAAAAPVMGGAIAGGKQSTVPSPPLEEKAKSNKKPAGLAADRETDKTNSEKQGVDEIAPLANKKDASGSDKKPADLQVENAAKVAQRGAAKKEAGAAASLRSRQLVMPVPAAIEERAQFGAANAPAGGKGEVANAKAGRRAVQSAPPPREDGDKAAPAKEKEQEKSEPAVVRVLILFELETARPAASPAAPAGKGPSGGA